MSEVSSPLAKVGRMLDKAGVRYAVIGAHAVNVWLEPRATAVLDLTVEASVPDGRKLHDELVAAGYHLAAEHGADAPSGPDFIRYVAAEANVTLELQTAKTALQREVIARAKPAESGVLVAPPEDLIFLKLIAWRAKDQIDLLGLARLSGLEWRHVERWATAWQVTDRLADVRRRADS